MIVGFSIVATLLAIVTWICIVQISRSNKLESMLNTLIDNMQSISDIIQSSDNLLTDEKLRTAFAGDDEIGAFFENIEKIQQILNKFAIEEDAKKSE